MPDQLSDRLQRLANRLDGRLALVSGRSVDNLQTFLGALPLHLAGSHGGHILAPNGTALRDAEPLPAPVAEAMDGFARDNGLLHERKSHGGALHYRTRPEFEAETHRFAEQLAVDHALSTKSGKCVIELVWPGADKGGAVDLLARRAPFADALPVFVGDDVTDEDGFAACARRGGFGIAVGERASAAARYSLSSVKDVHAWLEL